VVVLPGHRTCGEAAAHPWNCRNFSPRIAVVPRPEQLAQRLRGPLHVLHHEGHAPEPRGAARVARDARSLRRLHDLEYRLAGAEEGLPSGAAGGRALARAAEVEALGLELADRPVEVRREHHDVIHAHGAVRMRAGGVAGRAFAERPADDAPARPLPDQPQPDARDPAQALRDVEARGAPVGGLVRDLELVDARHAGRYP
jgi:hypothetical protein